MTMEIPGYYFDTEKKKYFKIEQSHTAPPSAPWSSDEVKRREQVRQEQQSKRSRETRLRGHIRRSAASAMTTHRGYHDVVARKRLMREMTTTGYWPGGGTYWEDWGGEVWVDGLGGGGRVVVARQGRVGCMHVGEGILYTSEYPVTVGGLWSREMGFADLCEKALGEQTLVGSWFEVNDGSRLLYPPRLYSGQRRRRRENVGDSITVAQCPQLSSIRYHAPCDKILLTSREPHRSCRLSLFSPRVLEEEEPLSPYWSLEGDLRHLSFRRSKRRGLDWVVHKSTPAPRSSNLFCLLGTNAGVVSVGNDMRSLSFISPPSSSSSSSFYRKDNPPCPGEIFDQAFQSTRNPNVILAGGRRPLVWRTDLRAPGWHSFPHHRPGASLAHVHCVNEHQVLVAGLRSSMCLYDLRFVATTTNNNNNSTNNGSTPILLFDGYVNEAHLHTGLDVSASLGLVAAAHDDGTVALFSLRTGRRLLPPLPPAVSSDGRDGRRRREKAASLASLRADAPVRALSFRRLAQEREPSLYVGHGSVVSRFATGLVVDGWDEA